MSLTTNKPLMPQATALWLIENTALTFEQIAISCGLHMLEIQALADGTVSPGIQSANPILSNQLTQEEIDRCTQNPTAVLQFQSWTEDKIRNKKNSSHYLPRIRRSYRPDGIAWILKNYPDATDYQISKLLHTTPKTIQSIRNKTHNNILNIKPKNPVTLGLCLQEDLETFFTKFPETMP